MALITLIGLGYTLVGGIKAVIWTEVVQVGVMIVGTLTALAVLLLALPEGLRNLPWHRLRLLNLSTDPAVEYTLWAALIGCSFSSTAIFGTDYDMVQRMLTARDGKKSRRAVISSGLADIPIAFVFLLIGTLLWVYYQHHPDPTLPPESKRVFLHFILTRLPIGIVGLVVAGILSVVLSSFESALNALAGSFTIDLYRPMVPSRDERHYLLATRVATLAFAAALAGVAIRCQGIEEILKFGLAVGTYTYGALLAVFGVGLFTKRGTDLSCVTSIPASIVMVGVVNMSIKLAFPWNVLIGTVFGAAWALLFGWWGRTTPSEG